MNAEYPYNQAYRAKIYDALHRVLCDANRDRFYEPVKENEIVDALIELAVNVMAVEHGDDGKEWVRERIYLREVDALVDHLDGLIAWHLRRTAAAEAAA